MNTVIATFEQTTNACPSQWQCETADGRYVYVRYRWGRLSAETASSEEAWLEESVTLFRGQVGEDMDGCMTTAEMQAHLVGVLDFSQAVETGLDPGQVAE